jgi:hypothetical protein
MNIQIVIQMEEWNVKEDTTWTHYERFGCQNETYYALAREEALRQGLNGIDLDLCTTDICKSQDLDIAPYCRGIQENSQEISGCTEAKTLAVLSYAGREYALLDGSNPLEYENRSKTSCHSWYKIPKGWSLAENILVNRAAIGCYPWGQKW